MRKIIVKPKAGLLVRDPVTRTPLKKTGEDKPRNAYWLRRIKDGSCELVTKSSTTKTPTQKDAV